MLASLDLSLRPPQPSPPRSPSQYQRVTHQDLRQHESSLARGFDFKESLSPARLTHQPTMPAPTKVENILAPILLPSPTSPRRSLSPTQGSPVRVAGASPLITGALAPQPSSTPFRAPSPDLTQPSDLRAFAASSSRDTEEVHRGRMHHARLKGVRVTTPSSVQADTLAVLQVASAKHLPYWDTYASTPGSYATPQVVSAPEGQVSRLLVESRAAATARSTGVGLEPGAAGMAGGAMKDTAYANGSLSSPSRPTALFNPPRDIIPLTSRGGAALASATGAPFPAPHIPTLSGTFSSPSTSSFIAPKNNFFGSSGGGGGGGGGGGNAGAGPGAGGVPKAAGPLPGAGVDLRDGFTAQSLLSQERAASAQAAQRTLLRTRGLPITNPLTVNLVQSEGALKTSLATSTSAARPSTAGGGVGAASAKPSSSSSSYYSPSSSPSRSSGGGVGIARHATTPKARSEVLEGLVPMSPASGHPLGAANTSVIVQGQFNNNFTLSALSTSSASSMASSSSSPPFSHAPHVSTTHAPSGVWGGGFLPAPTSPGRKRFDEYGAVTRGALGLKPSWVHHTSKTEVVAVLHRSAAAVPQYKHSTKFIEGSGAHVHGARSQLTAQAIHGSALWPEQGSSSTSSGVGMTSLLVADGSGSAAQFRGEEEAEAAWEATQTVHPFTGAQLNPQRAPYHHPGVPLLGEDGAGIVRGPGTISRQVAARVWLPPSTTATGQGGGSGGMATLEAPTKLVIDDPAIGEAVVGVGGGGLLPPFPSPRHALYVARIASAALGGGATGGGVVNALDAADATRTTVDDILGRAGGVGPKNLPFLAAQRRVEYEEEVIHTRSAGFQGARVLLEGGGVVEGVAHTHTSLHHTNNEMGSNRMAPISTVRGVMTGGGGGGDSIISSSGSTGSFEDGMGGSATPTTPGTPFEFVPRPTLSPSIGGGGGGGGGEGLYQPYLSAGSMEGEEYGQQQQQQGRGRGMGNSSSSSSSSTSTATASNTGGLHRTAALHQSQAASQIASHAQHHHLGVSTGGGAGPLKQKTPILLIPATTLGALAHPSTSTAAAHAAAKPGTPHSTLQRFQQPSSSSSSSSSSGRNPASTPRALSSPAISSAVNPSPSRGAHRPPINTPRSRGEASLGGGPMAWTSPGLLPNTSRGGGSGGGGDPALEATAELLATARSGTAELMASHQMGGHRWGWERTLSTSHTSAIDALPHEREVALQRLEDSLGLSGRRATSSSNPGAAVFPHPALPTNPIIHTALDPPVFAPLAWGKYMGSAGVVLVREVGGFGGTHLSSSDASSSSSAAAAAAAAAASLPNATALGLGGAEVGLPVGLCPDGVTVALGAVRVGGEYAYPTQIRNPSPFTRKVRLVAVGWDDTPASPRAAIRVKWRTLPLAPGISAPLVVLFKALSPGLLRGGVTLETDDGVILRVAFSVLALDPRVFDETRAAVVVAGEAAAAAAAAAASARGGGGGVPSAAAPLVAVEGEKGKAVGEEESNSGEGKFFLPDYTNVAAPSPFQTTTENILAAQPPLAFQGMPIFPAGPSAPQSMMGLAAGSGVLAVRSNGGGGEGRALSSSAKKPPTTSGGGGWRTTTKMAATARATAAAAEAAKLVAIPGPLAPLETLALKHWEMAQQWDGEYARQGPVNPRDPTLLNEPNPGLDDVPGALRRLGSPRAPAWGEERQNVKAGVDGMYSNPSLAAKLAEIGKGGSSNVGRPGSRGGGMSAAAVGSSPPPSRGSLGVASSPPPSRGSLGVGGGSGRSSPFTSASATTTSSSSHRGSPVGMGTPSGTPAPPPHSHYPAIPPLPINVAVSAGGATIIRPLSPTNAALNGALGPPAPLPSTYNSSIYALPPAGPFPTSHKLPVPPPLDLLASMRQNFNALDATINTTSGADGDGGGGYPSSSAPYDDLGMGLNGPSQPSEILALATAQGTTPGDLLTATLVAQGLGGAGPGGAGGAGAAAGAGDGQSYSSSVEAAGASARVDGGVGGALRRSTSAAAIVGAAMAPVEGLVIDGRAIIPALHSTERVPYPESKDATARATLSLQSKVKNDGSSSSSGGGGGGYGFELALYNNPAYDALPAPTFQPISPGWGGGEGEGGGGLWGPGGSYNPTLERIVREGAALVDRPQGKEAFIIPFGGTHRMLMPV